MSCRNSGASFTLQFATGVAVLVLGVSVMTVAAVSNTAARPPATLSASVAASGNVWLIFVDDLHLDFTATGHLKNLLKTVFSQLVQEGDLAGVVSTGPSSIAIDLTRDRARLAS